MWLALFVTQALANSLQIVTCAAGQALVRGASIGAVYIVQSGAMAVSIDGGPQRLIGPGGTFGEESVVSADASSHVMTATASSMSVLARITRESFITHVGLLQDIKDMAFNEKALGSLRELRSLTIAERRQIARLMSRCEFASGATILRAGADIERLLVVYSGVVSVQASDMHGGGQLGAGAIIGQAALLRHETSPNTLTAQGNVVCMSVSRDAVQRVLGSITGIVEREGQQAARKAAAKRLELANLKRGQILGVGTFGVVRLVHDYPSKQTFALKSMRKQKVYDMGQVSQTPPPRS